MNPNMLLGDDPIKIKYRVTVYSPNLRDIKNLGDVYLSYHIVLKNTKRDAESLAKMGVTDDVAWMTDYQFFTLKNRVLYKKAFYDALYFFTKQHYKYEKSVNSLVARDSEGEALSVICEENYADFVKAINLACCIPLDSKEEDREEDWYDRFVAKQKAEVEAELNAQGKSMNDFESKKLNLIDHISIFCSLPETGFNIKNVWDLNLYEFFNQRRRAEIYIKFNSDLEAMRHGAKDIDVKHYYCKLDDDDDDE